MMKKLVVILLTSASLLSLFIILIVTLTTNTNNDARAATTQQVETTPNTVHQADTTATTQPTVVSRTNPPDTAPATGSNGATKRVSDAKVQPTPVDKILATPTASHQGNDASKFAAVTGNDGPINLNNRGDNLTTLSVSADRRTVTFTLTTLNVPLKARGEVFIQNNSSIPQTLVSDTPDGFAPFTIKPYTSGVLVFGRAGTFKAHIQGYPANAHNTLTIVILAPYPSTK